MKMGKLVKQNKHLKNLVKLAAYEFRGIPLGIAIGVIIAGSALAYEAPHMLVSKHASDNTNVQQQAPKTDNVSQKQTSGGQSSPTSQPSNPASTSSVTKNQSAGTGNASNNSSGQNNNGPVTKPLAAVTGIAVVTPDPGANQDIYIPQCDFISIIDGSNPPHTCYHYKPIQFTLVATLSDDTTTSLLWSDAQVSAPNPSGGYPYIPTLLQIDQTNNQLDEGTGMGYFLGTNTSNAIIPISVKYQSWSYTKYIHIYVSSLWGTP